MKFTFVCCWNNATQLETLLKPSLSILQKSGIDFNTLLIDTKAKGYHSAAEAFNKETKQMQGELGDVLVFLHQDIAFDNASLFQRIAVELQREPNQILGVAGMPESSRTVSNLKYHATHQYITRTQLTEKAEVCSLDECLVAISTSLFQKVRFDEKTCSGWHLYVVDLCYEARRRFGTRSFVLPESIYHKADGQEGLSCDNTFLSTMWRIIKKYKTDYDSIYTPCYIVSTHFPASFIKLSRTFLKNLCHL